MYILHIYVLYQLYSTHIPHLVTVNNLNLIVYSSISWCMCMCVLSLHLHGPGPLCLRPLLLQHGELRACAAKLPEELQLLLMVNLVAELLLRRR